MFTTVNVFFFLELQNTVNQALPAYIIITHKQWKTWNEKKYIVKIGGEGKKEKQKERKGNRANEHNLLLSYNFELSLLYASSPYSLGYRFNSDYGYHCSSCKIMSFVNIRALVIMRTVGFLYYALWLVFHTSIHSFYVLGSHCPTNSRSNSSSFLF